MPQVTYTTKDGEMLDEICKTYYGNEVSPLQAVLLANPGLARIGNVLYQGITIVLPEVSATTGSPATFKLWE